LEKALAIYGSAAGGQVREGERPVQDKQKLVEAVRLAVQRVEPFCAERGVDLAKIQAAQGMERIKLIDDTVEAFIENDEAKSQ
jgi:type I restriction enzyme R subunit